jgi:hypothetical protein
MKTNTHRKEPHATSIEPAQREVQQAIDRARRCADGAISRPIAEVEPQLWTALLALGRALIALALAQRAAARRPPVYELDGVRYALDRTTRRNGYVGTRFGKVKFSRPVGRPLGGRGRADLPVDRELGLCSGFTLGTVTVLVRMCAMLAFGTARGMFRTLHEWVPSQRTTLRMVDAAGSHAKSFLDTASLPQQDGEILVIEVDGRGAPMITTTEYARRSRPRPAGQKRGTVRLRRRERRRLHPKPRRKKGDKSKNAKIAFVGVIYTLHRTPQGVEGPIGKRLIATFQSHEALFRWLREHADRRGYGRKRTVFLADGCDHIWRWQQQYLPQAEVCIDWYHIAEKLWEAGGCLYAESSAELHAWVSRQQSRLRKGRAGEIVAELRRRFGAIAKTGPGNKGRRDRLRRIVNYLAEHQPRMRYAELRRDDLDIATGAVEGAVRNLVGLRLDGPGMRWGRDRSEMILHLRCILLNGQWDEFAAFVARRPIKLAARPMPARTHDAKPQTPPLAA